MGWLSRKLQSWAISKQEAEIGQWLRMLEGMSSDEIASLVIIATHIRHGFEERYQTDLLDPTLAFAAKPNLAVELGRIVRDYQRMNRPSDAAGTMVWLFTVRCGTTLELRTLGRRIWNELRRGFPYVEEAEPVLSAIAGKSLTIDHYDSVPIGLEPERT